MEAKNKQHRGWLWVATAVLAVLVAFTTTPAIGEPSGSDSDPDPAPTAAPIGSGPVLLIMDASGSMNADDGSGQSKIEAARSAMLSLVDGLGEDARLGLRAYGHRSANTNRETGCTDTELLVPISTGNQDQLRTAIEGLNASGYTPIGASLRAAVEDLPEGENRTIILISDGIDTCAPPAACDVAKQIIAEGVDLRVEAVGFQVDSSAAAELQCIADATGGTYRSANSADDLARELRRYLPVGDPITGGPSATEAVTIGPGQYLDVWQYPEERWYAIDLRPGDRVRATATILGTDETPEMADVAVTMTLGYGDVLGVTECDRDMVAGLGPFNQELSVDGLEVAGGTVCSDSGIYVVGITTQIEDENNGKRKEELAASPLPIELYVAVTSRAVQQQQHEPTEAAVVAPPPPVTPRRERTPAGILLFSGLLFAGAGAVIGALVSRKLGP